MESNINFGGRVGVVPVAFLLELLRVVEGQRDKPISFLLSEYTEASPELLRPALANVAVAVHS